MANAYQTMGDWRQSEPESCAARGLDARCPLVKECLCAAFRDLSQLAARAEMPEAAEGEAMAGRDMGCPAE
jgi:hypothetical protein